MSDFTERRRPPLPGTFYRPEPAWVLLYFGYAFALFFGFGYLSYAAAVSDWPLLLKIPAVLIAALLASNGLHLLGWLAHEGIHLSMVKSNTGNMLLGAFAGSVLLFPTVGFGISHWPHHRFTNRPEDPDTLIQSRHQTFWRRLLVARVYANRQYFKNAIAVLLGKPLQRNYRLPFTDKELAMFSGLNIGLMVLWLAFYISVGVANPTYALFAFALPYVLLIPTTGIRPYLEHAGLQPGEFRDSRSYTSWFYTILLFGNNYHLEHHLYPRVPGYKLPKAHKWLAERGYFDDKQAPIVGGVLGPLLCATSRYPYPDAALKAASAKADTAAGEKVANV